MQLKLKTILNLKESHSHFVYEDIRLAEIKQGHRIEVSVRARQGSLGICSCCSQKSAGYDRLSLREFIHVPIWGLAVVLLYRMRRVNCPRCGIVVESVPWGEGKSALTHGLSLIHI